MEWVFWEGGVMDTLCKSAGQGRWEVGQVCQVCPFPSSYVGF